MFSTKFLGLFPLGCCNHNSQHTVCNCHHSSLMERCP
jgi:hypothetical protein